MVLLVISTKKKTENEIFEKSANKTFLNFLLIGTQINIR